MSFVHVHFIKRTKKIIIKYDKIKKKTIKKCRNRKTNENQQLKRA